MQSCRRNDLPIGVFDSGVGGLSVLKNLVKVLPSEKFLYLGDTARVPYGNRSPDTIIRYSKEACSFLVKKGIKVLVIACNTVSAVASSLLKVEFDIPVIGVIESTSKQAVKKSRSGRIGVIGTRRTILSGAYRQSITLADSRCEVFGNPAPLLVPLAEEGITQGEIVSRILDVYLTTLLDKDIDVLILGCTHYEVFTPAIEDFIASRIEKRVEVVDSSTCVAETTKNFLIEREMLNQNFKMGENIEIFVTDDPENLLRVGGFFFGSNVLPEVHLIKL